MAPTLTSGAISGWRRGIVRTLSVLLVAVGAFAPLSPVGAISETPVSVSTGPNHTCAVDTDGTLWCWGYANSMRGYLGDGTDLSSTVPVQVGTDTDWAFVSAGTLHTCATKTDGSLWCWGSNYRGQLGIGTIDPLFGMGENSPVQVGADTDWRTVSSGGGQTCGVKTDDTVYCWGFNRNGELGDGTAVDRLSPVAIGSNYLGVSVGGAHSCAITTAHLLKCWGWNPYGGIGDGTTSSRLSPTAVNEDTDWVSVSAGLYYTCATKEDGSAWCWGLNSFGGVGSTENTGISGPGIHAPFHVGTDTDWVTVTAGNGQSCGMKVDGSIYCWGQNFKGELGGGGGDSDIHATPVPFVNVPDPAPVEPEPVAEDPIVFALPAFGVTSARAAGTATWSEVRVSTHSCATTSDNRLYCWGDGVTGGLGQGNTASSKTPLQVALGAVAAPTVITDPLISELPEVGVGQTALAGSWTGAPVPAFTYQWYRCTKSGAAVTATRVPSGCTKLTGATTLAYTPVRSDLGKRLRLAVKATNSEGSLTRYSASSDLVVSAPYMSSAPTISGTVRIGRNLTAKTGNFGGTSPLSYAYQWYACNSKVRASSTPTTGCVSIGGATRAQFTVTNTQSGKYLVVSVTATNAYGNARYYSAATSIVR